MAHMWFGDLVTMRWWDDLWLNESFATYMATLAIDGATRFPNAWVTFSNDEKAWARYQDQLPTTHPIATDAPDVQTGFQNFDGITYAKGASVLRQLAAWVGGEEFLDGCRRYFERHAWGNASLADFLEALEDASGRTLGSWAESWLETTGMNTLRLRADTQDDRYVDVAIEQSAPEDHPTIRPHRLQVGMYDLRDDRLIARDRIDLDIDAPLTPILAMEGEAPADLVLLNDGDLTFARVEFDKRSMRTVETHLAALDDPLARTLCWATAWEMVRDAVLPARRFAELVRTNIPGEDDIGVVQTLHGRGRTAVELYGDPRNADAVMSRFADDARSEMDRSDPGSDRQLAWARQWISSARTDEHVGEIAGLLDSGTTIDGLDVDTELRWRIIASLAARGVIGEAEIASEHERDPSDLGARRADAARASRPELEAKETAWSRVVDDPTLSHSDMKAIMGGFSQRTQEELLRPFVPRYFEVLPRIWEERQLEVALDIAERLYPAVVDDDVIARTDRFLEGDVARPLRRTLLEQRDTVVRALRTRALDVAQE
jgi:aminopeptidase N